MSEDNQYHGHRTEELCGTLRCGSALKVWVGTALCALLGTRDGRRTCDAKAKDACCWIWRGEEVEIPKRRPDLDRVCYLNLC
jgi:hypothetical protein